MSSVGLAKNGYLWVQVKSTKELIMKKWPGTFISCEKFHRTQKSTVGLAKKLTNESEKICKELKMTGHFSGEKFHWTRKSTVGLRKITRNFYNDEKFRRTRKELTNESEKTAKSLKWPDTFIVKSTVGLAKNL